MRVKMLTVAAGPDGCYPVGAVRTVRDGYGAELVAGGFAVSLENTPDEPAGKSKGKKAAAKTAGKPDKEPDKEPAGDPTPAGDVT